MAARPRALAIVVALAALAAASVDFALGASGWPGFVATALELALAIPWAVAVLSRRADPLAAARAARLSMLPAPPSRLSTLPSAPTLSPQFPRGREGSALGARIRGVLVNLVFVVLVFGALLLKGSLLASGRAPGQIAHLYRTYLAMALVVAALGFAGRGDRTVWFFGKVGERPARMLLLSLTVAAALGGFLLATPFAQSEPLRASLLDSLFDATGALCGALSVTDVGRQYTPFGQLVILVLMQIGGFGIMVLSSSLFILGRKRMEVRSATRLAEVVDADSLADLRAMVRGIITWTVFIEAIGALALYGLFQRMPGIADAPDAPGPLAGGGGAAWSALFHSVSAFCNAGFSLFRANVGPFASDPAVNGVLCALIVLGGLGFPVLSELGGRAWGFVRRRRQRRLSLHARVVLTVTALLIVLGAAPLFALEYRHSFAELRLPGKLLAALFQSITARTAGFASVDLAQLTAPSMLIMSALMFIGAGPASTGGGIKVTTLAVLFATFRAEQTAAAAPSLFAREIPPAIQRKAVVVTILSALLVLAVVFLVLIFEDQPPLMVLHDVVSAFGSVGCSTGVAAKMGVAGKALLMFTMIVGRVGPLTFALAAAAPARRTTYRLPAERVMIG